MLEASDRVLKLPYRGAPQTISVMQRAVLESADHVIVRNLAEEICQGIDSKDYMSEALANYYFLLGHTRYMRDPRTVELVKAPHVIASAILAGKVPSLDCDDLSLMLSALDIAVGCKCDFVTAAFADQFFNGERQYSHVFERVTDPRTGQCILFDPVAAEKTPQMLKRVKAAKIWPIA